MARFVIFPRELPLTFGNVVVTVFVCIFLVSSGVAQEQSVTASNMTPVPGAGHDYVQAPLETVNPADGSLSLRLSVPTVPGRQLTLPFSFSYDSNGVHVLMPAPNGTASYWSHFSTFIGYGGWSYTMPLINFHNRTTSNPSGGVCRFYDDYVLQDPSGIRHSFPQQLATVSGCSGVYTDKPNGSDDYYSIHATLNSVTVADADGTVYSFDTSNSASKCYAGPPPNDANSYSCLANSAEDRNGNKIAITDLHFSNGSAVGAFNVIDTLGRRSHYSTGFGASGNAFTVPDLSNSYVLTWGTASSHFTPQYTAFGSNNSTYCTVPASASESQAVVTAITLPDGRQYTFQYESTFGMLSKITYPTGGYVQYTWQMQNDAAYIQYPARQGMGTCQFYYSKPYISQRLVSYDGSTVAQEKDFSITTNWTNFGVLTTWITKSDTVTTYDRIRGTNFNTVYTYAPIGSPQSPYDPTKVPDTQIPVEQSIVYKNVGGATLRTVNKTWYDMFELKSQQTILDNGQSFQVAYTYGPGAQVIQKDEYDFGGTLARSTTTVYHSFAATPIFPSAPSILDRPDSVTTYNGSGTQVAQIQYIYDQPNLTCCVSSLTGHDNTNYSPGTGPRGNATQETRWLGTGASPVTIYSYDETGQVLMMTDPCGNASCADMTGTNHSTTYSYADNFASGTGTPPGNTNGYLTRTTNPLGHTQNFTYDYNGGKLTVTKDANGQSTAYVYNDPLRRPTQVNYPDGGLTQYFYSDVVGNVSVEKKKSIDGTRTTDEFSYYDGMGHQISHSIANGESVPWDKTDSCFDGLGRTRFISYPYQANSAVPSGGCPSEAGDSFSYDALSRITSVRHSDNSVVSTSYTGRATDVLDEGNGTRSIERVSQVDGLGRLVSVCEVTSTTQLGPGGTPAACGQDIAKTGFLTSYGYNALGDLLTVTQGSLAQRNFTYDSLSRLLTATNPESGTTCYGTWSNNQCVNGYDVNGNISYRTRPAPNQTNPATTVTTTYRYDPLNRVTQRAYSDGVTPAATFIYDQTGTITIASQSFPISNSIGRLTSNCTGPTISCLTEFAFSYDSVGRVNQQEQFISGWSGATELTYNYDLLGNETSDITLGNNSTYNVAGRLTALTHPNYNGPGEPANVLASGHYDAYGHLISAAFGDGLSQSWAYDARGRVQAAAVGTNCSGGSCSGSTVYRYTVGYAPNSDVTSSTDIVNGTWTYVADDFNRLASSSCTANCPNNSSSQTFTYRYDRYSNRWQQNAPQGGPQPIYTFSGSNNHVDGLSYDAAGNLRSDGNHSYAYDAENRLVSVDNGAATYVYDAEGRRVQQKIGSQTCSHWYDQKGRVVIRTSAVGATCATWQRYAYAGNMLLGTYTNYAANQNLAPLFYAHGDWVGTVRARVDTTTGAACQTIVSLPFGDGQTVKGSCGTVTSDLDFHHFTGKERDTESGLDNFDARMYASTMGRFIRPDDPFSDQHPEDPQSWNLYSYVRNNPLSFTDPSGHECVSDENGGWKWSGSGETCEDVGAQNQEYKQSGQASATVNGCEGEGAADCLAFAVSDLTSTSSLSEVGVNGIMGAQAAEGIWELPGLFRSGWDLISGWRMASKMAGVRAAGQAGELAAGIIKNTERIPSTTGAAYRVPDILDKANKIIGEVKNYTTTTVSLTNQLKDDLAYAAANGYTVELRVRQGAQLSQSVQQLVNQGKITLVRF